jgi:hypothetical protein
LTSDSEFIDAAGMDIGGRQKRDAAVTVLVVVPGKEIANE